MKIISILSLVVLSIVGIGFLLSGSDEAEKSTTNTPSYASIVAESTHSAKIYDVRTPQEYAEGHFEGAINWPIESIQAGKYPSVPKDTKIYVYCRSGNRSSESTALLKSAGFTNVIDLGGLASVSAIGGDIVK